jgi:hypothetical protein
MGEMPQHGLFILLNAAPVKEILQPSFYAGANWFLSASAGFPGARASRSPFLASGRKLFAGVEERGISQRQPLGQRA